MDVDALAPSVTRSSVAVVLNIQGKQGHLFHKVGHQTSQAIPMLSNDGKCSNLLYFLRWIQYGKD